MRKQVCADRTDRCIAGGNACCPCTRYSDNILIVVERAEYRSGEFFHPLKHEKLEIKH
jgi:hypothetical protein